MCLFLPIWSGISGMICGVIYQFQVRYRSSMLWHYAAAPDLSRCLIQQASYTWHLVTPLSWKSHLFHYHFHLEELPICSAKEDCIQKVLASKFWLLPWKSKFWEFKFLSTHRKRVDRTMDIYMGWHQWVIGSWSCTCSSDIYAHSFLHLASIY